MHAAGEPIIIGDDCWIGMNSVILPGVILGSRTTVGAGSVVTKSFPEGNCIVAGNPAKIIKQL
ncbi:DapH/DapD/GlmU-related protein [Terrabacter aerolatus]|uniref:DapH/DapD/GlmU-related protein n=1 Tax=Terrabacter aerolatus TaxID=422442 RepID=UPI00353127F3